MNQSKVLFVDDESNFLDAMIRATADEDFLTLTARSAQEADGILNKRDIDVVVCDYQMPQMTGTEFLAELYERHPQVVRILLTGNANLGVAVESINKAHVYSLLRKPCSNEELLHVLHQALSRKRLADKAARMADLLHQHADYLEWLERVEPGMTSVKKDAKGEVVLKPDTADTRELVDAALSEINRFRAGGKKANK